MTSRPVCTIILREDGTATLVQAGVPSATLTTTQALDIQEMVQPHLRENENRQRRSAAYIQDCVPWQQSVRVEQLPAWAKKGW